MILLAFAEVYRKWEMGDEAMPKKNIDYPEQVNFLARSGTLEKLIAIAYMRGENGKYAGVVRDLVSEGLERWVKTLTDADRKRYESILKTVRETAAIQKTIRATKGG